MLDLLDAALFYGKPIEAAPVACSDPDCGWVSGYILDPETEEWDEVPEYVECGFNWSGTDCSTRAKVFKSENRLYRSP